MRIASDNSVLIEAVLSGFLRSLAGAPGADLKSAFWLSDPPLIGPDGEIIRRLSSSPSEELKKAWSKQIAGTNLFQLVPKASENQITITPTLTALAIVAYNFLKIHAQERRDKSSELISLSIVDYNFQLCATLNSAANLIDGVIFDSLIDPCCRLWREEPHKTESRNSLLANLLSINPFSELKNIDLRLPIPLQSLAGSYLAHKEKSHEQSSPTEASTTGDNNYQWWWLQSENFILSPPLMRILRDQWLSIPENHLSAIGLGIFLEELRRRGKEEFRIPILEFYEAYDFMQRHQASTPGEHKTSPHSTYQKLTIIQHLLQSKERKLNQKGNEYFLKFRALLEIIAEKQSIPSEFRHLSREFCLRRLAPLTALATVIGGHRQNETPTFGEIEFSDE